jgi:ribosomal protein S18 acetylase RimI-like enzyme
MLIRPATSADLPQLSELVRQEVECQQRLANAFELTTQVNWVAHTSGRLSRPASLLLVAADNAGNLRGFIDLRIVTRGASTAGWRGILRPKKPQVPIVQPSRHGYIEDIYVVPGFRKAGAATQLMEGAVAWLAAQGVAEVEAAIWARNAPSLAFFQARGFDQSRILMRRRIVAP